MIKFSKEQIFNNEFIVSHQRKVKSFILNKKLGIDFFNHSFSFNEVCSDELLNSISFDPFVQKGLIKKNEEFLKDYYEISRFLLHGNDYLKIIKIQHNVRSGSLYKKALADERIYIIDKFRHNNILKKFGISNPDIVKNEKNYLDFHKKIITAFKKNNKSIAAIFNYNEFLMSVKNIRNDILNNIKITICPYCNRQYIDTYSYNGEVKSLAQIDHQFPKSIFPLYSLTLLNFIPSCSYCNCIIKKDKLFPWANIYSNRLIDEKYFHVIYNNVKGLYGDMDGFDLKVIPKDKDDINNSYFFRHREIYENHKSDVANLLKKRLIFTDGYRKSIEKILSTKMTEDEFRHVIFGVTGNEQDYSTIPLSKLKNDILKS